MFRAEAKGQPLQFDTAGVIGANEVFKDRQTGSRWQQSTLQAIDGPLQGTHLELHPFLLTNWREWRRQHPDTLVLKPLPGYAERIPQYNQVINEALFGKGEAPKGALRKDDRLPPRETILGLDLNGAEKAFPLSALRKVQVVNDQIGGRPVLVVHQPDSDTTTAFVSQWKERTLTFTGAASGLTDQQTHSRWDAYGHCTAGKLKGARLQPLILEPEFWFAWSEFHPKTAIYTPPSS